MEFVLIKRREKTGREAEKVRIRERVFRPSILPSIIQSVYILQFRTIKRNFPLDFGVWDKEFHHYDFSFSFTKIIGI